MLYDEIVENPQSDVDRQVYSEDRRREPVREVYSEDRVLEPRVEVMYAQPRIRDGSGRDTRTARKISKPPGDIPEKIRKASRAQY